MNIHGNNTVLITGSASGIGRALAEAFHQLGNKVVIAGRRNDVLETVVAANPGISSGIPDVTEPGKLNDFAAAISAKYPALNVLVNMAGIMKAENWDDTPDPSGIDDTIATSLTAQCRNVRPLRIKGWNHRPSVEDWGDDSSSIPAQP